MTKHAVILSSVCGLLISSGLWSCVDRPSTPDSKSVDRVHPHHNEQTIIHSHHIASDGAIIVDGEVITGELFVEVGELTTQTHDLEPFTTLMVNLPGTVNVSKGEVAQAEAIAQESILERINVRNRGNVLEIEAVGSFSATMPITINLVFPNQLDTIIAAGQAQVHTQGAYSGEEIALEASGQSAIALNQWTFTTAPMVVARGQSQISAHVDGVVKQVVASDQSHISLTSANTINVITADDQADVQLSDVNIVEQISADDQAKVNLGRASVGSLLIFNQASVN